MKLHTCSLEYNKKLWFPPQMILITVYCLDSNEDKIIMLASQQLKVINQIVTLMLYVLLFYFTFKNFQHLQKIVPYTQTWPWTLIYC